MGQLQHNKNLSIRTAVFQILLQWEEGNFRIILQMETMPLLCDNAGSILQYHFYNEIVLLVRNGL